MDVKAAYFNGILNKEAYVEQPKGFEDPQYPDHVYKLRKHGMTYNMLLELGMIC